jgi:putative tryptophan/tyrosine transport system substrate-binding protein
VPQLTKNGGEPTSFTSVGNEADLVMAADVRPLMSRLTPPAHQPTLAPNSVGGHDHDAAHYRTPHHSRPGHPRGAARRRSPARHEYSSDRVARWRFPCLVRSIKAFQEELREFGYIEGQTILLEYRSAEGQAERLPDLAAELVRLNVDVIVVASSTPAAWAAKHATTTIPIVFVGLGDPLGVGLVASLARPGGNLTGSSLQSFELATKRLELLKQALPHISRVAFLLNSANPIQTRIFQQIQAIAPALGVQFQSVEMCRPDEVENAFATMTSAHIEAFISPLDPIFQLTQRQIVDLAIRHRIPGMHWVREFADAGGLMSYGPNIPSLYRRAAAYVNKILRGAKPAELPVEQPTQFALVINLKTAQALGLTIPPTLLFQATEVIR